MMRLKRLAGWDMDLARSTVRWGRQKSHCTQGGFGFCLQVSAIKWKIPAEHFAMQWWIFCRSGARAS